MDIRISRVIGKHFIFMLKEFFSSLFKISVRQQKIFLLIEKI